MTAFQNLQSIVWSNTREAAHLYFEPVFSGLRFVHEWWKRALLRVPGRIREPGPKRWSLVWEMMRDPELRQEVARVETLRREVDRFQKRRQALLRTLELTQLERRQALLRTLELTQLEQERLHAPEFPHRALLLLQDLRQQRALHLARLEWELRQLVVDLDPPGTGTDSAAGALERRKG